MCNLWLLKSALEEDWNFIKGMSHFSNFFIIFLPVQLNYSSSLSARGKESFSSRMLTMIIMVIENNDDDNGRS